MKVMNAKLSTRHMKIPKGMLLILLLHLYEQIFSSITPLLLSFSTEAQGKNKMHNTFMKIYILLKFTRVRILSHFLHSSHSL